jgi:hypothetical protein
VGLPEECRRRGRSVRLISLHAMSGVAVRHMWLRMPLRTGPGGRTPIRARSTRLSRRTGPRCAGLRGRERAGPHRGRSSRTRRCSPSRCRRFRC